MLGMQGMVSYGGSTRPFSASREGFSIWVEQRPGYKTWKRRTRPSMEPPLLGRLSALRGHLALNTPRDMQLRTASQVEVLITR
jgi:hypothetical protein